MSYWMRYPRPPFRGAKCGGTAPRIGKTTKSSKHAALAVKPHWSARNTCGRRDAFDSSETGTYALMLHKPTVSLGRRLCEESCSSHTGAHHIPGCMGCDSERSRAGPHRSDIRDRPRCVP